MTRYGWWTVGFMIRVRINLLIGEAASNVQLTIPHILAIVTSFWKNCSDRIRLNPSSGCYWRKNSNASLEIAIAKSVSGLAYIFSKAIALNLSKGSSLGSSFMGIDPASPQDNHLTADTKNNTMRVPKYEVSWYIEYYS